MLYSGVPGNRGLFGSDCTQHDNFSVTCTFPKGPCTQELGTWDLGKINYSTGFGQVSDY